MESLGASVGRIEALGRVAGRVAGRAWLIGAFACSAAQQDAARPAALSRPSTTVALASESGPPPSESLQPSEPEPAPAPPDPLSALSPPSASTSLGSPSNGRLEGGVALPLSGPGFRFNDRRNQDARYGTVEVVRAIARAAAEVARELPGGELVVNDLGLQGGGRIAHHGSHRAGRDADILFYLLDDAGRSLPSVGAPLDPEGVGHDYKDLARADDDMRVHFDAPRTWRFVKALLEDPQAELQRVFVAEHLRAKLLAEAARSGAPAELVTRFSEVSCQPSYPHDDHLHVRWFCSFEDLARGCEDLPPLYPWRAQALARTGVQAAIAKRTRSEDPAPIVTQAQAEREVAQQNPHPDVLAFLRRRKAWEKQPHPGRPYCP